MKKNISIQNPQHYLDRSAIFNTADIGNEEAVKNYYSNIGIYHEEKTIRYEYAEIVQYIMSKACIVRDLNGHIYIYNIKRGVYEPADDFNLSIIITFVLNQAGGGFYSSGRKREIEQQMKGYIIPIVKKFNASEYYTFSDKAYDVETFETVDFSPKHFNFMKMDYNCVAGSTDSPVFDKFLNDFTCGDNSLKVLLQEITGYLFCPENSAQRGFIMLGPARSGKSTMAKLFTMLLGGVENGAVISTPLQDLSSCFGLEGIENAKAIITTESEKRENVQTAIYKAIVSGDSVSINAKHKKRITIEPKCKIISFTNHMPQFTASDPSLERRLLIFPCEAVVSKENIDTNLLNKLQNELPAIFNWAMEGLKRLKDNNWQFSETEGIKQRVKAYIHESDPMYKFIEDMVVPDTDSKYVKFIEIQKLYEKWAKNNGIDIKINRFSTQFTEHLESLNIKFTTSRQKGYDGLKGISLNNYYNM